MTGKTIALMIIGFLIGVLAAGGIGVRVIEEVRTDEDATSLPPENIATTTTTPLRYFVDPHETLVASTAVVPKSVVRSETALAIEYELVSLSPSAGVPPIEFRSFRQVNVIPNDELPFVYPRTWTASTKSDTFEGFAANPDVRVARFELPDDVVVSDIISVDIVDPLMAFPLDVPFSLSEAAPTVAIIDGVEVRLLKISVQADSTIVQIEVVVADVIDLGFTVEGLGAGWRTARAEASGRPRINLTWVDGDLPSVMTFRARGIQWVELTGTYPVSIERFG